MPLISPPPNWITAKDTARLTGRSLSWLQKARKGLWDGPPWHGFNRSVGYKENEVLIWIETRREKVG